MILNPIVSGGGGSEIVTVTANGPSARVEYNLYYADETEVIRNLYMTRGMTETFQIPKGSMIALNNGNNGLSPITSGTCEVYDVATSFFVVGIYSDATITMG